MFGTIFCILIHCYFIAITVMTLIIIIILFAIFTIFIILSLLYFIIIIIIIIYYLIHLLFINCNDDLCVISFAKESVERAILQ